MKNEITNKLLRGMVFFEVDCDLNLDCLQRTFAYLWIPKYRCNCIQDVASLWL